MSAALGNSHARTARTAAVVACTSAALAAALLMTGAAIASGGADFSSLRNDLAIAVQLAVATFVSEDLACVGAGVLVAGGHTSYALGAAACFAGIFVGDLGLFAVGRLLGRRMLAYRSVRRFVTEADLERSADWLERRGTAVILASRFLPGTRLPTYLAAGMLGTSAWRFAGAFALAAAAWTPALVALAAWLGGEALESALAAASGATVSLLAAGIGAYAIVRASVSLGRARSRRLAAAKLRRLANWEFWPPWMFYPPVIAYIGWLAIRHRGLTVFTAANPAIPDGGFVGESKFGILSKLDAAPERVARTELLRGDRPADVRLSTARSFMETRGMSFPVILKPDVGQRGEGVEIVRSEQQLAASIEARLGDTLLQEYAPGHEFGVFWVRRPGDSRGWIASITEKRFPAVVGDGSSTVSELVDADDRAVLVRGAYAAALGERMSSVPAEGETVPLVEIGSHCRGAVFLDGSRLWTAQLERAFDRVTRGFEGFCFGRYDVRVESIEAFARGEGFTIVELNGVTAEATHIYDPRTRLVDAYRTVFGQWRTAFEIGAANRARGFRPTPAVELAGAALEFLAPGLARRLRFGRKVRRRSECNV